MKVATKKKRRLTRKQVCKVLKDYNLGARIDAYLATLGPLVWRKNDVGSVPGGTFSPAMARETVILTKLGMLGVSDQASRRFPPAPEGERDAFWEYAAGGNDDAIMCVFDEADRAAASLPGVAHGSGKWNHHAFVAYCHAPTDPDEMREALRWTLDSFCVDVERITLRRPIRLWRGTYRPVQLAVWEAAEQEALARTKERITIGALALDTATVYTDWHNRAHGGLSYPMDQCAREHWIKLGGVIEEASLWDPRR